LTDGVAGAGRSGAQEAPDVSMAHIAELRGFAALQPRPPVSVADIVRQYAPEFVRRYRQQSPQQVQSTLAKLALCRTPALGSHLYRCEQCDHQHTVFNSCGDRHCPQCAGAKRADWLESTAKLLLPNLDYYQVVFTMPAELSSLALGNRRTLFDLLFCSAWRSLKQVVEDEQQFEAAAAMVLHTWNQKLDAHVHVHALVPGGGPSLTKPGTWKTSSPPLHENQRRLWLVDADVLRVKFRDQFLDGLRRLHDKGELKLTGEWAHLNDRLAFDDWLKRFEEISWVTYIQKPPENSSPEHVVKYLARYMTGGPISDRRLASHEDGIVTFSARTGKTHGGSDETENVELTGIEFVRRWSLHILPKGYTKTRRFGGYSNHHRQRYITECRELLDVVESNPAAEAVSPEVPREHLCPNCNIPLRLVSYIDRPGWAVVMNGPHRPNWYDDA